MADHSTTAAAAISARYGVAMADFGHWNETLATLFAHRTVRAFTGAAVPQGTIETLVAAAQSAATSSNMQTWSVIAVTDADTRAKFAEWTGHQAQVREAPFAIVEGLQRLKLDATCNAEVWDREFPTLPVAMGLGLQELASVLLYSWQEQNLQLR